MPCEADYACDIEFMKLLAHRQDVDVARAALELARDAYPHLDFHAVFSWIDDRSEELAAPVARAWSARDALKELARSIGEFHGIYGDRAAYDRPDSSYLHQVIGTKRGIPISLSILYMAIAGKLGIELEGVAAPKHFLTRYESSEGPVFLDPFARGRIMALDECSRWLRSVAGVPLEQVRSFLKPASPRAIIVRMLNNLKALHIRQKGWQAAWVVQHRLTALQPASYQERRDLAVITLRAQRPGQAIELLQSCLKVCPDSETRLLTQHISAAEMQLSRWN